MNGIIVDYDVIIGKNSPPVYLCVHQYSLNCFNDNLMASVTIRTTRSTLLEMLAYVNG